MSCLHVTCQTAVKLHSLLSPTILLTRFHLCIHTATTLNAERAFANMSDTSDSDESGSTTDATSTLGMYVTSRVPSHKTYNQANQNRSLLKTSAFSDLTLTCHGREIKVHKNILYARSEYFRKMLLGPFKVCKKLIRAAHFTKTFH